MIPQIPSAMTSRSTELGTPSGLHDAHDAEQRKRVYAAGIFFFAMAPMNFGVIRIRFSL